MRVWWHWAKYVLMLILATCLFGSVECFLAFNYACFMKIPDFYIEEKVASPPYPTDTSETSVIGFFTTIGYVSIWPSIGLTIMLLSVAKTFAVREAVRALNTGLVIKRRGLCGLRTYFCANRLCCCCGTRCRSCC